MVLRHQVKRQLENLDTVGIVSVEKNTTLSHGASEWTVTFETELGDLPMLEITSGRLTGNCASLEHTAGYSDVSLSISW